MSELRKIKRALFSLSDKTGAVDLARALVARGVSIISTGGTARSLREGGIEVTEVADVTGESSLRSVAQAPPGAPAPHPALVCRSRTAETHCGCGEATSDAGKGSP